MSSPIRQSDDLDPALRYAPRWVRERGSLAAWPLAMSPAQRPSRPARPEFSGDLAMMELQRQLMLHPDAIPEPALDDARTLKPIVLRLAGVMGLAALIAWGIVSFPSVKKAGEILSVDVKTAAMTGNSVDSVLPQAAQAVPRSQPGPAEAVPQSSKSELAMSDAASPAAADPSKAVVATVATAAPLPGLMQPLASPPAAMPSPPQAAPFLSPVATAAPAEAAMPHIDDTELTGMIKRGEDLLMSGDIASARLLLRRAADAGNAQAALALGASFDPLVIRRLGAVGMKPDVVQAKQWYQRAADLGSASAMGQLAKLEQSQ